MTIAIAAAGTGGHVVPALTVAEQLVASGVPAARIVFFGGDRLEATAVPAAGFPFFRLDIRGLQRSLTASNLTLPAVVMRSARRARRELAARAVRVVLAMGGYVTVPVALAARRSGTPYLLHEQNASPGLANRLMARGAERVLVAFPAARERLPKTRLVGNPVRPALATFDRSRLRPAALARFGLTADAPVVGVLGGSQGARILNESMADLIGRWHGAPFQVIHLAGPDHAPALTQVAGDAPLPWRVLGFEEQMEDFYAAADVVLARAGAMTISELAATATPGILVPLSAVQQEQNADVLVSVGGAEMLPERRIQELPTLLAELLADPLRRRSMAAAAARIARPEAARTIADLLLEVAGE